MAIVATATGSAKRVLCFFAHPDDESYSVAGTAAWCAKNNARVWMVYCTRGEAGPNFHADSDSPLTLAQRRTKEAEQACRTLGINPPMFLDLPDGRLSQVDDLRAKDMIAELLVRIEPHLVLGLGPDGAYGHLDHVSCHRWLDDVISSLQHDEQARCLWAVFPKGLFSGLFKKLKASRPSLFSADMNPQDLGVDRDKIDLHFDVSALLDVKRKALSCHESQLPTGEIESFLLYPSLRTTLGTEMFVHAHGKALRAGATDPLQGL